jgi:hypothetical protein
MLCNWVDVDPHGGFPCHILFSLPTRSSWTRETRRFWDIAVKLQQDVCFFTPLWSTVQSMQYVQ